MTNPIAFRSFYIHPALTITNENPSGLFERIYIYQVIRIGLHYSHGVGRLEQSTNLILISRFSKSYNDRKIRARDTGGTILGE